jgi:hypothetical protein
MQQFDKLYYYSSGTIFHYREKLFKHEFEQNEYGLKSFFNIFKTFAANMSFHDRSEVITTPFNVKTIPEFKLPNLTKTVEFEEICNNRAIELLNRAKQTNRKLLVMYSGGIDSTLILVSLLKNATPQELKDHVHVLMSEESIMENKKFYTDYVLKYFKTSNSYMFNHYMCDPKYIFTTGEGNDQLFGSQVLINNVLLFGQTPWEVPVSRDLIVKYFRNATDTDDEAEQLFDVMNKVCVNAPIAIDTMYKWFWWINFTCKWQSVFLRSASFTKQHNQQHLKLFDNYEMFFSPPDFQLWSMNNSDILIGNSYKQYKKVCKDIIYNFNKDEDYRDNKLKYGSLRAVLLKKPSVIAIDENQKFINTFDKQVFFNQNNSFMPT